MHKMVGKLFDTGHSTVDLSQSKVAVSRRSRPAMLSLVFGAGLFLTACTTSGGDGVLSSVIPGKKTSASTSVDSNKAKPGENPNAGNRLKNTRTALSDYCPAVRIRAGTETFRTYPKGADKENADNIKQQATITKVARECDYVGQNLKIKVGARGRLISGPKGSSGKFTIPIRVAVLVGNQTIYSKLHRNVQTISAGKSNAVFSFVDENVVIPAPTATNVRIYLGFDEGPYNTP